MPKAGPQKRLEGIRQALAEGKDVSAALLARKYQVSEMTIHRDLNKLQANGLIVRKRGSVEPAERMEFEFNFAVRRVRNQKAKQAIAREALNFIAPGMRIILDTGTTTLELACLLRDYQDMTVITPSLAVASVLQFSSAIQTVLLGGILCKGSPDLTGVVTETVLDMFMVDAVFQGADAISLNGELFNSDIRLASADRKMRQRARQTYILCDSSKIGFTDLASNGNLSQVDALVTDHHIKQEYLSDLKKSGTRILTVHI